MTEVYAPPQGPCFRELAGKVALVTGGGSGIGKGISLRLAAEGMTVVLCGRTERTLAATSAAIHAAGGQARPVLADMINPEDITRLYETIAAEFGGLDLLVHNAASLAGGHRLMEIDAERWRKILATNLDSIFYLAQGAMPLMRPRGMGTIVLISTIGAQRAHHNLPVYDASKAAMESLTRSLALELAEQGIRVNAIAPGPILGHDMSHKPDSPWAHRNLVAFDAEIPREAIAHKYVPLGRFGVPADIAAVVAFLASTQSAYITGQVLTVDGGATIQLAPKGIWI